MSTNIITHSGGFVNNNLKIRSKKQGKEEKKNDERKVNISCVTFAKRYSAPPPAPPTAVSIPSAAPPLAGVMNAAVIYMRTTTSTTLEDFFSARIARRTVTVYSGQIRRKGRNGL